MIGVGHARYIQIYDEQLPTGDPTIDAAFQMIETTIEARTPVDRPGTPGHSKSSKQMALQPGTDPPHPAKVRSYIWAAVLHEQILVMRQPLAA